VEAENQEFARLIREAGWTYVRTAEELSLHPGTIGHIVKGRQRVSMTALRLLAERTGGKIQLPGVTASSRASEDGRSVVSVGSWEHELIQLARKLPREVREHLVQTARFLAHGAAAEEGRETVTAPPSRTDVSLDSPTPSPGESGSGTQALAGQQLGKHGATAEDPLVSQRLGDALVAAARSGRAAPRENPKRRTGSSPTGKTSGPSPESGTRTSP